ncbi:hypothetical protein [Zestomonas thermotolerans]|nr:hypothetical protein [Pseudomonas thermotolerans]
MRLSTIPGPMTYALCNWLTMPITGSYSVAGLDLSRGRRAALAAAP